MLPGTTWKQRALHSDSCAVMISLNIPLLCRQLESFFAWRWKIYTIRFKFSRHAQYWYFETSSDDPMRQFCICIKSLYSPQSRRWGQQNFLIPSSWDGKIQLIDFPSTLIHWSKTTFSVRSKSLIRKKWREAYGGISVEHPSAKKA